MSVISDGSCYVAPGSYTPGVSNLDGTENARASRPMSLRRISFPVSPDMALLGNVTTLDITPEGQDFKVDRKALALFRSLAIGKPVTQDGKAVGRIVSTNEKDGRVIATVRLDRFPAPQAV